MRMVPAFGTVRAVELSDHSRMRAAAALTTACMLIGMGIQRGEASEDASDTGGMSPDSVAAVWVADPVTGKHIKPVCSAVYIGDRTWLSSEHCFAEDGLLSVLVLENGESSRISVVRRVNGASDIAVLGSDKEIGGTPIRMADSLPSQLDTVYLYGFGTNGRSARRVPLQPYGLKARLDLAGGQSYTNLIVTKTLTNDSSCEGDSGGPVLFGEQMIAIHTGGELDGSCFGEPGQVAAHSIVSAQDERLAETIRLVRSHQSQLRTPVEFVRRMLGLLLGFTEVLTDAPKTSLPS